LVIQIYSQKIFLNIQKAASAAGASAAGAFPFALAISSLAASLVSLSTAASFSSAAFSSLDGAGGFISSQAAPTASQLSLPFLYGMATPKPVVASALPGPAGRASSFLSSSSHQYPFLMAATRSFSFGPIGVSLSVYAFLIPYVLPPLMLAPASYGLVVVASWS
jgi:hypothetical protein